MDFEIPEAARRLDGDDDAQPIRSFRLANGSGNVFPLSFSGWRNAAALSVA
jgi:hypothetical protein